MIAVTGIGIVSPYGLGVEDFRNGSLKAQGLNPIEHFDAKKYGFENAGCIPGFQAKKYIPAMKARRMSRFSQIALIASREAWKMSGFESNEYDPERFGVIVGTGLGSIESTDVFYEGLVKRGPLETNPMLFPETVQNIAAAHISIELGISGPNTTFSQGDISGESAIFYAAGLIRKGVSDAILVCGADELTEPLVAGMKSLRVLSGSETLTPFDKKRNGIVLGEGAAAIVIERAENADKRGATVLGHIRGFGFGSDCTERLNYATSDSMARTIESALKESGISPDFISASANSTKSLDRNEAIAIRAALGRSVSVCALKSQVGSFMSSGVMKLATSLISLADSVIPPVFGLETPEIQDLSYVCGKPLKKRITSCLINGFSHGGSNMCIVISGPV